MANDRRPASGVEPRGRGRAPSIDRSSIERAVKKVGDSQAVSMHAVAKELDVNVTTLYRHTGGLEGLKRIHAALVSKRAGRMPSTNSRTWQQWLAKLAEYYRRAFLNNPDLLRYAQAALDPDFNRLERATKILIEYGFEPKAAVRAHAFLVNNVVGYVHQELQTERENIDGITPTYSRLSKLLKDGSTALPTLSDLHLADEELDSDKNFNYFINYAIEGVAAHKGAPETPLKK